MGPLTTAVPQRRQRSSLLMLLGCLIVYSLFIITQSTKHVISPVTTISDQPTNHKMQAQQTVITPARISQSRTSDQELRRDDLDTNAIRKPPEAFRPEHAASSASGAVVKEKNTEALPTISKEEEPETQILPEESKLSITNQSTTNEAFLLDQAEISELEEEGIDPTTNETSNLEQSSQATLAELEDDGIDPVAWSKLKIAVFMTSHLSEKHLKFLNLCWPYASGYLPLLQNSHLILFTSSEPPQDALDRMQFKSVTVRRYVEPSASNETGGISNADIKQMGAKRAMVDPFLKGNRWFDGYDWVIRLNPDVLIRRDTWIRQTMMNTSIDGIFVDFSSKHRGRVHSDFYAFRPKAANDKVLIDNFHKMPTAETHVYSGFRDSIHRKRVAWLPGAKTRRNWARLIGKDSPVIHFHPMFKACPHYFNATHPGIY